MAHFVPRPYQALIHNFGLKRERGNIFSGMGTGKTAASIHLFDTLQFFGEAQRALVLGPKRVVSASWPEELAKWRESFPAMSMAVAVGTPDQRLAALRRNADITCINYDNIDWLLAQYGDLWPFDTVFADESTRLKGLRVSLQVRKHKDGTFGEPFLTGQGATRAKAFAKVAHKKVRRWYNLTGTPAPNGLQDLWGQQWFVDGGFRLGNTFDAFTRRWFCRPATGGEHAPIELRPHSQAEIERLMRDCSITIDARDWFDISEPIPHEIYVDLPPGARKQYREMQRDLFTWVEQNPLEAVNAGVKGQKCLQLASGAVWIDRSEKHWERVHDEKLEALESVVNETNGEPLLISLQFRPDYERILKRFPKFKTLDHRNAYKDFKAGRLPGLVVHPKSAGHGLSMAEHCRIVVDYSSGFDLEYDQQVLERVGPTRQMQLGKKVDVHRYRIIARDTIEHTVVLPRLRDKLTLQEAFSQAMKQTLVVC